MAPEEIQGRADVSHDLGVGGLHDDLDHLSDVGDRRRVGHSHEKGRRDGHITQLGEAAANVLDVVVDTENLGGDDYRRESPRGLRPRDIGRQGETVRGRQSYGLDD